MLKNTMLVLLAMASSNLSHADGKPFSLSVGDGFVNPLGFHDAIAYRHGDSALVVYFDGHVGEVTKEDMIKIDEYKDGGQNHPFWKGEF